MVTADYSLYDEIEMKKPHPCGNKNKIFQIVRIGADIKIKCLACGHILMLDRSDFNSKIKSIIAHHSEEIKNN